MKIILSVLLASSILFPQKESAANRMERLIAKTGQFVKLEVYYLPNLFAKDEKFSINITKATTEAETGYFLFMNMHSDTSSTNFTIIAENEIKEIQQVLDV